MKVGGMAGVGWVRKRWFGHSHNFCVQVFLQYLSSCCFMTFRYLWLGEGDWVS
jgi:hypothetical protein